MQFTPFPILYTERLLLRQLTLDDWEQISFLRSDSIVNQYVDRPPAYSKEDAIAFIQKINTGIKEGKYIYWALVPKGEQQLIGTICLWNFSQENTVADIGYDLHPKAQGKGYMSEAVQCILYYGFEQLHLQKIEAYTHRNNEASIRLLERLNFQFCAEKSDPHNADHLIFVKEKAK